MEVKSKSGDVKWTNLRLESFDSPKSENNYCITRRYFPLYFL